MVSSWMVLPRSPTPQCPGQGFARSLDNQCEVINLTLISKGNRKYGMLGKGRNNCLGRALWPLGVLVSPIESLLLGHLTVKTIQCWQMSPYNPWFTVFKEGMETARSHHC